MSKTVKKPSRIQALTCSDPIRVELPAGVVAGLEQSGSAFFALCVDAGSQVLTAMMESDRTAACGRKGQHDAERGAVRAGSAPSTVTLGGRRVPIQRLRARSLAGAELELPRRAPRL